MNGPHAAPARPAENYHETYARWRADPGAYWLEIAQGIDWIRRAMQLNPYHPERYWNHLGRAYYAARRYPEAAAAFARISAPDASHHAFLAATFAQMRDATAAAAHAEQVMKRAPDFSVRSYLETLHYKQAADLPEMARLHAMNIQTWRHDEAARDFDLAEIDALSGALTDLSRDPSTPARVAYTMGELVLQRV